MKRPDKWVTDQLNKAAVAAIQKFIPYSTGSQALYADQPEPPYRRRFNPMWVYNIRENHALINNAIEEKVSQTFRRTFDDWQKKYEAKCPKCKTEFQEETPFRTQYGDFIPEDEDIDFEASRVCPECGEKVQMLTPNREIRELAEDYFRSVNGRDLGAGHLQPTPESGVGQSFLELCKQIAWDIESFDDGWMLFQRKYLMDEDGHIVDYDLAGAYRGAPELMSFSINDEGHFGGEYWVCVPCRDTKDHYTPEKQPQPCSNCGSKTYEVLAYSTTHAQSDEPVNYYIRGEFVHASQYEPSRYYGFSPIITLYDEARAIEKMDEWYREAYEQRRAPRGALVVRSSNADATKKWNRGQLEKLNNDSNHIPTLMDDSEGGGGSDPIKFVQLLDSPADMQMMEMRDWIKERISAKYGVTEIMMSGSPENSGLSQSMEVQVSNRAADRLRRLFNEIFIPAFLGQLGVDGWIREVADVEEEDEMAKAERAQRELQIAEQAARLGLEVEWRDDNTADVHAGEVTMEDEMGGLPGMGDMGGDFGDGPGLGEGQNQLDGVNQEGGMPRTDPRPADDNPAFGRMAKDLRDGKEIEVYNEWSGEWEKAEAIEQTPREVKVETETGVQFALTDKGKVRAAT